MHSGRLWIPLLLVSAGSLCLAVVNAYTIPRYSARYEQDCNLCHMNPTGGGQRTTYSTQYIVPKELALLGLDEETLANIDPQLSKAVTIGADARTMYFLSDLDETAILETPPSENFFQMQGNLYVNLQMTDRFSLYFHKGLGPSSSTPEIFGLGYSLPANGWVTVGRFVPDFGWRTPDHTAFVRHYMASSRPGKPMWAWRWASIRGTWFSPDPFSTGNWDRYEMWTIAWSSRAGRCTARI